MRETSELAMPDTLLITRPVSTGSLDPVTGIWTPDPPVTVHDGPGRIRPPSPQEIEVLFGGEEVTKQRYVGTVPWDSGPFEVDDHVVITAGSDPGVADVSLRVVTVSVGSWLIDRRLGLETVE